MDRNEQVFNELLTRLEPDLDGSVARYHQLRLKMIKFFQWKRCSDAEMLADETIARAIKKILEGEEIQADDPYVYIRRIAHYVYNEFVRKEIKTRTLLTNLLELPPVLASASKDSPDCRVQCLQKIPPEKLKLLYEYFLDQKSSQQLTEELNTTVNGLRLQIHRLKKALDACHEDCLKKLSES